MKIKKQSVEKRTYEDRKVYQKEYHKNWKEKNPEKYFANLHYGMPLDIYNKRLIEQKGLCEICNNYIRSNNRPKHVKQQLVVDHNHTSGKFRGLLCWKCNTGLGDYEDNVEYLKAAILYLQKYKDPT
jgi:hypothetical protein